MMKVQMSKAGDRVILRVEGRLSGVYVPELEKCWKEACALQPACKISLDLKDVTSLDSAGGYLLRLMCSSGVEVIRANLAIQGDSGTGFQACVGFPV
jgi:anti-anti-sigma factor